MLLHNLKVDQVAAHLGLGSLYRDQQFLEKALDNLDEAFALTEALVSIEDSPGLQDNLGVILTTQGEILNSRADIVPARPAYREPKPPLLNNRGPSKSFVN